MPSKEKKPRQSKETQEEDDDGEEKKSKSRRKGKISAPDCATKKKHMRTQNRSAMHPR